MSFVKIFDNKGAIKRTQELNELLQQAKQSCREEEQILVIERIVSLILRSRPLCHQYQEQPLTGVYLKLYQKAHLYLTNKVTSECRRSNSNITVTNEWLKNIQLEAFKKVLDDAQLKQLAINAQKQPRNSVLRSYALTELIKAIKVSQRLCRPHKGLFASNFYPVIYEEAVVQTMTYICTKIDNYDPQRGQGKFMNWVNFRLDKNVLMCRQEFSYSGIGEPIRLADAEIIPYRDQAPAMADLLYQCIENDSQGFFQKKCIPGNAQANFRAIALKRLSGKTWKEIAEELDSNISRLSAFYRRNCQKFQTILKQELENQISSF